MRRQMTITITNKLHVCYPDIQNDIAVQRIGQLQITTLQRENLLEVIDAEMFISNYIAFPRKQGNIKCYFWLFQDLLLIIYVYTYMKI